MEQLFSGPTPAIIRGRSTVRPAIRALNTDFSGLLNHAPGLTPAKPGVGGGGDPSCGSPLQARGVRIAQKHKERIKKGFYILYRGYKWATRLPFPELCFSKLEERGTKPSVALCFYSSPPPLFSLRIQALLPFSSPPPHRHPPRPGQGPPDPAAPGDTRPPGPPPTTDPPVGKETALTRGGPGGREGEQQDDPPAVPASPRAQGAGRPRAMGLPAAAGPGLRPARPRRAGGGPR